VTLLVKSKCAEKRSYIERLKGKEIAYIPLVTLTPMALEIGHRDLPNRVSRGQVWASGTSNHATRRQDKASTKEKLTSANLRGDDEPIRSAYVRTEVNKMMTRFAPERP
jgi:hypothetical protein